MGHTRRVAGLLAIVVLTAVACQQSAPPSPPSASANASPAGDSVDTATQPAGRPEARVLRAHVWACDDGSTLHTSNASGGDTIVLHLPDGDRRLPQVVAASGAKYEDGSTVFWTKGVEASFERKPGAAQTCREQRALSLVADAKARGVTFRGTGNEPG